MRNSRLWLLFAVFALVWLAVYLVLPPIRSGTDVFIFRDAGWNLAASGAFKSAALMYMPDLVPRLYAHYTPIMPLLFAAYAFIFPRNAYAGTIFNLLAGLAAAAVALGCVLRQAPGKLRDAVAIAIAVLPVVFITNDRPEAIALIFFVVTVAAAAAPDSRPIRVGLLLALTFMAHPFFAIAASIWVAALYLARNWDRPGRWTLTLAQIAVTGATALVPIALVALLYYSLDRSSLMRFAQHALGVHSGLNTAKSGGWFKSFRWAVFGVSPLASWTYLASLATILLLAAWAIVNRSRLGAREGLPIVAGLACTLISITLFSFQYNYVISLAFFIPLVLLIVGRTQEKLVWPGLAFLLLAGVAKLPVVALGLLERAEQRPSYQAARGQPAFLLAQLPSADSIVTVEGDSYDLFKPEFRNLIHLRDAEDVDRFSRVAGVANCYDGFHGADNAVIPFPAKLNASDFHLVQGDPKHMWMTLLGHRVMRAQWGYGCDLYVRNGAATGGNEN
jgi:hypothetical protein